MTDREKQLSARAYGYTEFVSSAELDRLVPLSVAVDPDDPRNLWLEPNDDPRATTNADGKDYVETALHDAVCAGRVGLDGAASHRGELDDGPGRPGPGVEPCAQ